MNSFNPDVLQKSLKIMELQDILVYTNKDNMENNANLISQKFVDQEFTPLDYSYCIYTIERYNSLHCKILAKLTAKVGRLLLLKFLKQSLLQELKFEILERIFFPLDFKSTPHYLLYFLEKNGFYEGKDFLDRIIQLKRRSCNKNQFTLPFIVWFMPLFESYDPEFCEETVYQLRNGKNDNIDGKEESKDDDDANNLFFTFNVLESKRYQPSSNDFGKRNENDFDKTYENLLEYKIRDKIVPFAPGNRLLNFDKYELWFFRPEIFNKLKKDNWKLHSFLCENGFFPGSIEEVIVNDDIDKFIEYMKMSTISYETRINYNIFYHSHVISEETNLIEFAAFYSSIKIFKYLINSLSKEDIELLSNKSVNCPYLATYGNSFEIIKICEQFNFNLTNSLFCAACFYKHEILNWLIEVKDIDIESYSENYLCPLHQSASSNNLRSLFYLLYKGANINKSKVKLHNEYEKDIVSPLMFGIEFNRYHTTQLLLSSNQLYENISSKLLINMSAYCCDMNNFMNVLTFCKNKDDKVEMPSIYTNFATNEVAKYVINNSNEQVKEDELCGVISVLFQKKNFEFVSLLYNKYNDVVKANLLPTFIDAIECENSEAVKIFTNDQKLMDDRRIVNKLMMILIRHKLFDAIKIFLLRFKDNDFKLSELLSLCNSNEIEKYVSNSPTLFFKVYKYEKNEFFLSNFSYFVVFYFFFLIRILDTCSQNSYLFKKAKEIVDNLH